MLDGDTPAETQPVQSKSLFQEVGDFVVKEAKDVESFVEGVFVDDVQPFFTGALALVERNGGTLLMQEAAVLLNGIGEIAQGQWGTLVTQLIANAKNVGAQLLAAEESLAANTALQIVQASKASGS